ncbi:MAG: hypothetical protein PVJ83_09105 [Gammaproteobacteria bacterium]|jgi:hypothetical protein
MYSDNLTLAGLLVTLPHIVMLIMISRHKTAPDSRETGVSACSEMASCCYGT